eukprot:94825_1
MGNETSSTSRTRYTCTCPSHGTLYSGYSESECDWYSDRPCPYCQNEVNERAARERAQRLRDQEVKRLEEIERQKRIAAMAKIEQDRKDREAELLRAKKKADVERLQNIENLKQKLKEDFNAQKKRFDNHTKDENKNEYDDLLEKHKLDTLELVKDIGERVKNCSAAGEEVVKYVDNIKDKLKDSLKQNYKIIEPEVDRYEKYGQEMRDMNDIFVEELGKVLKKEFVTASDTIDDDFNAKQQQNDANNNEYNELVSNTSNLTMEERLKQFVALAEKADKQKEAFKSSIKQKMGSLMDVIDKMESKLNLMDEYYQNMIKDHEFFIDFCINKGKEYGDELANIQRYFVEIGEQIKGRKRDLYEGQSADVERKTFTAEYEKYDINQSTTETKSEDTGMDDPVLKGMKYGAISGAVVGGAVGLCALGPPGLVGGALCGALLGIGPGMLIGMAAGSSNDSKTYKTTRTTWTKSTGSVTLTGANYYDGDRHNNALQQIVDSLKEEFEIYLEKLKQRKKEAENQKEEADDFKQSIDEMKEQICTFKLEAEDIMEKIEEDKFDRDEINGKCEQLFVDVNLLMDVLDEKSKNPQQKWE